jgi:hypothetical protein
MRRCVALFTYKRSEIPSNANMFLALLPALCPDERDKFQLHLYLPCTQGAAEGGPDGAVCQLWLPGMWKQ